VKARAPHPRPQVMLAAAIGDAGAPWWRARRVDRLRDWEERIMDGHAAAHWPYDSAPSPRAEATMRAYRHAP